MAISFECFRENSDWCGNWRFGESPEESWERGSKVSEFFVCFAVEVAHYDAHYHLQQQSCVVVILVANFSKFHSLNAEPEESEHVKVKGLRIIVMECRQMMNSLIPK